MPNKKLQKSLKIYLSKLKKTTPQFHIPPNPIISSTSWILSGCKHPKTPSFAVADQNQPDTKDHDAATLTDIDQFLFENFNSLFCNSEDDNDKDMGNNHNESSSGFLFKGRQRAKFRPQKPIVSGPGSERVYSNISKTQAQARPSDTPSRQFFASPSTSNSLIEEGRLSSLTSDDDSHDSSSSTNTTTNESISVSSKGLALPDGSIAVLTYSPEPYDDFQRSMQDMVEARLHHYQVDWDFMEELLFCYLKLNEKKSYKYILRAFVDLIVILRQHSGRIPAKSVKSPTIGERKREM
ncbi:hypothetical protein HHK36_021583 [Tetracentron sinense]|uniref:Transcription repressor n=1 Tax=Tetracentron sinense TaxID=13715 RepID=A0A834YVA2_TETSI|nr:hypothetical protein HHK36_021583 [Tetracentron sinense]